MSDGIKLNKPGLFCGAAIDLSKQIRGLMFLLMLVISASMCFSQFGIVTWGNGLASSLNFIVILGPVALCVTMLGVVPGVGLAFITGMLIMFRAWWTPATQLDFQLSDPFLSVVSITVGAILMAAIVIPAARKWPADPAIGVSSSKRIGAPRIASIAIGCLVLAFVFSYGMHGLIYLFVTPGGAEYDYTSTIQSYLSLLASPLVLMEAIINGVILSVACIMSVAFDASRRAGRLSGFWRIGLDRSFAHWLALSLFVAFLVASSVSFCVETVGARDEADTQIVAELEYLQRQVDSRESDTSVESIAEGYSTAFGGTVLIVRDNVVVSSNDPSLVNASALKLLSCDTVDHYDFLIQQASEDMLIGSDNKTKEFYATRALTNGDYTYIAIEPVSNMYKSRTSTLISNAGILLAMLFVVFLVVHELLRHIVVGPMRRMNSTLERITEGELSRRVSEHHVNEFNELSTGINTTVSALRDMVKEVEQRNERDLTAAKTIQEATLPREFPPYPDINRFDIYANMKTAKEVGGDFFDFFLVGEGKLAFVIADVSGKGIPAALFMMTAKTQIKGYLSAGLPVNEAVNAANRQLCLGNDAGMFVTAWIAELDYETGALSYVNAGHNPPLLLNDGQWDWMRNVSGMPLGLFDGIPYDLHEHQLAEGDTLFLYTDGVTEAMDTEGRLFGEDRLMEMLRRCCSLNARSISLGVRRAVIDFSQDAVQSDDITMLTLRYGVPPEKRAFLVLSAKEGQLVHVYNFIHEELHRRNAPKSAYNQLDIAAEELFVNVCQYAYPDATPDNPGEVRISFEYEANPPALSVTFSDDGIPYDPLAALEMEPAEDSATDSVSGLGIRMARQSVDDMCYERIDGSNVITFRKGW